VTVWPSMPAEVTAISTIPYKWNGALVFTSDANPRMYNAPKNTFLPRVGIAVRLSDHSSFWDAGFPALMVTDTSFFRNPHYHQASDTPDTLDYPFLARVTAGDPMRLVPTIEKLVREVDPGLRLRAAKTYSSVVDHSIVTERIMAALGGFFGLLALLVACLGIFGAMAFQVSRRVNEIGLRMALGASRGSIVALMLREVAFLLVVGCVIGGAAAAALTGLTRKMLFGVSPTEPLVFALAAVVLGLAAFAAGWIPARRASLVDPMVALRHE